MGDDTNRARYVVNKEILDLLNEESISGARITGICGTKKLLHA